jgi:DNA-binding XRE family transcriptional regulator
MGCVMELAIAPALTSRNVDIDRALRIERASFAAKLRASRAVLGLSQDQFAQQIDLTQRSVHRLEQGAVQPKLQTIIRIQRFWLDQGISFEDLRNGGFRLVVDSTVLMRD